MTLCFHLSLSDTHRVRTQHVRCHSDTEAWTWRGINKKQAKLLCIHWWNLGPNVSQYKSAIKTSIQPDLALPNKSRIDLSALIILEKCRCGPGQKYQASFFNTDQMCGFYLLHFCSRLWVTLDCILVKWYCKNISDAVPSEIQLTDIGVSDAIIPGSTEAYIFGQISQQLCCLSSKTLETEITNW